MFIKKLSKITAHRCRHITTVTEHDYVIVGAGSAGCVLANRISTSSEKYDVMVLEAGPSDNTWKIRMPAALMYCIKDPKYDWCYETLPQTNSNNRIFYWPRGKVVGGSSSINAMVYIRGHPEDFNRWEKEGATGWNYKNILPYFRKAQKHTLGSDKYRGGDGPLAVSRGVRNNPLFSAFIEAGKQAGYGYTDDCNGYRQEGFGPFDMTIGDGARCSAAVAYLNPLLRSGAKNLHVQTGALVCKLLHEGGRITGVEYLQQNKIVRRCMARKEVILSGGAINSPQLLLLSGIGPADELRKIGIDVLLDQKQVGRNLQDHLEIYIQYKCKKPVTLYKYQWKFPLTMASTGVRWFLSKTGPGSTTHLEAGAFIRSRPDVTHPDIQLHFLPGIVADHGKTMGQFHAYQAHAGTLRATSRGTVRLRSANPMDPPLIDPAYLNTHDDVTDMRNCVKLTREIFAMKAFDEFRESEISQGFDLSSDNGIDAFVRQAGESAYHPSCTLAMGSHDQAAVDPECRFKGLGGLRVVDASIMPSIVSGNLNASVIMMAERAADIILGRELMGGDDEVDYWRPDVGKQR